ncbi:hypothetical protein GALMADRAFT_249292 [Galerina marginata CBS 339.88]|uniref:Uncharacterized protein n=1 Tax=Galerina marginata (strain CBS 339.88) TaxID=685588 RepID=A0A067T8F6_GALM3|nr:hypothetical protein GALMADRAFT_249292 [Galerina marginata CBS 339.88]
MEAPAYSAHRNLPDLPVEEPSDRHPQSLDYISTRSSRTSDFRASSSRERSSRETKSSFHTEIERGFQKLHGQVQQERKRAEIAERRAEDAERQLQELGGHLKAVNEARLVALREASRANEELKLYRIQLETAQREIYRAQEVISIVDRQRLGAEKEAAKNRTKARQLNELVLINGAREEAYKLGLQEGLDRGRELAFDASAPPTAGGEEAGETEYGYPEDDYSFDDTRPPIPENDHYAYPTRPRSIAPSEHSRHSRAPSMRPPGSPSPVPVPLPTNPPTTGAPSRPPSLHPSENTRPPRGSPSPVPVPLPSNTPSRPPSFHPSEDIRPISMRNISHTPRMNNIVIPPDNLIPSLDADNRIRIPPPFEFHRTPERAPSPQLPALSDSSQEPLPVPPRSHNPPQRKQQHRRNSSSDSSTLSQLDILSHPHPYTNALRTPMSIIPEVNSVHTTSPLPRSEAGDYRDHILRHQRSISENSVPRSQVLSINNYDRQSPQRPGSRSSYAGSRNDQPAQMQQYNPNPSITSVPDISIQPPSLSNKTDSLWGGSRTGSRAGGSPSGMSQRATLPPVYETHGHPYPSPIPNGMPGGYINTHSSSIPTSDPPVIPSSSRYDHYSSTRHSRYNEDAVSSAMSGDTLTTPPEKHRSMEEDDWSGAIASAAHVPIQPSSFTSRAGSSNTAVWTLPVESASAAASTTNGKGKKKRSSKT